MRVDDCTEAWCMDRQPLKSPQRGRRPLPPKPPEHSLSVASDPSGPTNPSLDSPVPSTSGQSYLSESNNPVAWGDGGSSLENARRALSQLEALVDDAVFLDDDSFNGMKTLASCQQRLQGSKMRIRQLSEQLLAAQAQLARKDEQIKEEREKRKKVEAKVDDLNSQLENNAELLRRNEEIERLTAVIEGLGAANP